MFKVQFYASDMWEDSKDYPGTYHDEEKENMMEKVAEENPDLHYRTKEVNVLL